MRHVDNLTGQGCLGSAGGWLTCRLRLCSRLTCPDRGWREANWLQASARRVSWLQASRWRAEARLL